MSAASMITSASAMRRIRPDQLHPELPELAVPSFLGALVPEAVGKVTPAQGFWGDLCLVDVHPDYRGGDLGSEGELPPPFVLKDIHLLDDPFTGPHGEEFEILKFRAYRLPGSPSGALLPACAIRPCAALPSHPVKNPVFLVGFWSM